MEPGSNVQIVKHSADGRPAVTYSGRLMSSQPDWVAVRADWVHGDIDIGALIFQKGDYLYEYFSLERPYNAFALFREDSSFVGWYCNVTRPTTVCDDTIHWHDLIVDVVVYPDGEVLVLDEEELASSGLGQADPDLYDMILAARDELLAVARTRAYPFSEIPAR